MDGMLVLRQFGLPDLTNGTDNGKAQALRGVTVGTFVASLASGLVIFAVQVALFFVLKFYLPRIYRPRTYLVPERERIDPPPRGFWQWLLPVFKVTNSELIHKCGLDAFFFLRFLRLLLKMFVPMAIVILPIILPLNAVGGRGVEDANSLHPEAWNVTGLDHLGWGNVRPDNYHRYWAHLILAVCVVAWLCYLFYDELRDYIRLRQAYLTSPQHRLRASATTVLVTAIPSKWVSVEALDGLFDVFPGGLRNIWLNRNFDALNDKVNLRDGLASRLENAEVLLVRKAKVKHAEMQKKAASKKKSKEEQLGIDAQVDGAALDLADAEGLSAGDPHQMATIKDLMRSKNAVEGTPKIPQSQSGPMALGDHQTNEIENVDGNGGQDTLVGRRNAALNLSPSMAPPRTPYSTYSEQLSAQVDGDTDTDTGAQKGWAAAQHDDFDNLDAVTKSHWKFWEQHAPYPSPRPHGKEDDEFPLNSHHHHKVRQDKVEKEEQKPDLDVKNVDELVQDPEDAVWRKFLKDGDRDHMRLPAFGWTWMPFLPVWMGIGKKVDTIYYCRREVARLNAEIERDQKNPEKFPLMNSAFIQFNHQLAAHMACQSVSHHVPEQMAPRMLEISPDDVVWENMSIRWWERYVRTAVIIVLIVGMNVLWIIPTSFTGALSQLANVASRVSWLHWYDKISVTAQSIIQGILPPLLLSLLVILAPLILRLFHWLQGLRTGVSIQLAVQVSYFAFLFVQVFLIITISSGLTTTIQQLLDSPTDAPSILAQNLPQAANYFFSYMILQALSVSAGALLQIFQLIKWFIFRPIVDGTPRDKFKRQLNLNNIHWGKFFPVYTNLAVVGVIYSIITPLILVFNLITFSLFWVVYRYNILFVNKFRHDTGGLLFPRAINQLFTGLYFMELCLIGLFFLVRDYHDQGGVVCKAQGIIMIVVLVLTVLYQVLLNQAFSPLFKFLPITLEDDAVRRDEEYARVQAAEWGLAEEESSSSKTSGEEEHELQDLHPPHHQQQSSSSPKTSWATESRRRNETRYFSEDARQEDARQEETARQEAVEKSRMRKKTRDISKRLGEVALPGVDVEAQQRKTLQTAEHIFGGLNDEVEDLTPAERNVLIDRAFRHKALRARRPVIWLPRDDLGVSDYEIRRTEESTKNIWISNRGAAVDSMGKCIFRKNPPDFSELDLIVL